MHVQTQHSARTHGHTRHTKLKIECLRLQHTRWSCLIWAGATERTNAPMPTSLPNKTPCKLGKLQEYYTGQP